MEENNNFLARWISNDLTDKEFKEFKTSKEYLAYKDILAGMNKLKRPNQQFDQREAFQKQISYNLSYKKKPTPVISLKTWVYSAAAVVLVLIGIQYYISKDTLVQTSIAEQLTHELPDNSEIVLNASSTIRYHKKNFEEERTLTLEGEAFFKVAKGSKFTVQTNQGEVTVLGTEFNISAYNNGFQVNCYEGKVAVQSGLYSEIITKGQGVALTVDQTLKVLETKGTNPTWINGISIFTQVPLAEVIAALQRQYDILIDDTAIDTNRIYTGSFTHKNLKKALRLVFEPMDIMYTFEDSKSIKLSDL